MNRWYRQRLQMIDGLLPDKLSEQSIRRREARTTRLSQAFLRGPIPLLWLTRAAKLHGKALAVGLALWFRRGVTGTTSVTFSRSLLARFEISRHANYRALKSLEQAGLVRVVSRLGKVPIVEILDVTQDVANSGEKPHQAHIEAASERPRRK
jgi:hypothetical protein